MSNNDEVLEDLLRRFNGVFATPVGLLPIRPCSYQIRLLPGTALVVVRPYCYAHLHEELQCADMLHQGVIRLSSSAFSVPMLLVKKQDGS
jgi:hypothetical protein